MYSSVVINSLNSEEILCRNVNLLMCEKSQAKAGINLGIEEL